LEKFQETLTVTLLGLTVCSLFSIKNILCGLHLYLCKQIVLYIIQKTMRFLFSAQNKSVIFTYLILKWSRHRLCKHTFPLTL